MIPSSANGRPFSSTAQSSSTERSSPTAASTAPAQGLKRPSSEPLSELSSRNSSPSSEPQNLTATSYLDSEEALSKVPHVEQESFSSSRAYLFSPAVNFLLIQSSSSNSSQAKPLAIGSDTNKSAPSHLIVSEKTESVVTQPIPKIRVGKIDDLEKALINLSELEWNATLELVNNGNFGTPPTLAIDDLNNLAPEIRHLKLVQFINVCKKELKKLPCGESLETLDLSKSEFSDPHVFWLLKDTSNLRALYLNKYKGFNDEQIKALNGLGKLEYLYLSGAALSAPKLVALLHIPSNLEALVLFNSKVKGEDYLSLWGLSSWDKLTRLELEKTEIGAHDLGTLFRRMLNLQTLALSESTVTGDLALGGLPLKQVKNVNIKGAKLSVKSLVALSTEMPLVDSIDASGCEVEGYLEPRQLPDSIHLKKIVNLKKARISPQSFLMLSGQTPNPEVDLSGWRVTDDLNLDGPQPGLNQATVVNLRQSTITAPNLARILGVTRNVEALILSQSTVQRYQGGWNEAVKAEAEAALKNLLYLYQVKDVDLKGAKIPVRILAWLLSRTPNAETLILSGCNLEGDLELGDLPSLERIKEASPEGVSLRGATISAQSLALLSSVLPVDVAGCRVKGKITPWGAFSSTTLKIKNLEKANISLQNYLMLLDRQSNAKEVVNLSRRVMTDDLNLDGLSSLNQAKRVDLTGATITVPNLIRLLGAARNVETVNASRCSVMGDLKPSDLSNFPQLKFEKVEEALTSPENFLMLLSHTLNVEVINLSRRVMTDDLNLDGLSSLNQAKRLDLTGATITVRNFIRLLVVARNVETVNVSRCSVMGDLEPSDLSNFPQLKFEKVEEAFITSPQTFLTLLSHALNVEVINLSRLSMRGNLNLDRLSSLNQAKRVDLTGATITVRNFIWLLVVARNVETVNVSRCRVEGDLKQSDLSNFPQLKFENPEKAFTSPQTFLTLLSHASDVEIINLSSRLMTDDLDLDELSSLSQAKKVDLTGATITVPNFRRLLGVARNVETVDVLRCTVMGDLKPSHLSNFPQLKFENPEKAFTSPQTFLTLRSHASDVEIINLSNRLVIADLNLDGLSSLSRAKKVDLTGATITVPNLIKLLHMTDNLETLILSKCKVQGVLDLKGLPPLRLLNSIELEEITVDNWNLLPLGKKFKLDVKAINLPECLMTDGLELDGLLSLNQVKIVNLKGATIDAQRLAEILRVTLNVEAVDVSEGKVEGDLKPGDIPALNKLTELNTKNAQISESVWAALLNASSINKRSSVNNLKDLKDLKGTEIPVRRFIEGLVALLKQPLNAKKKLDLSFLTVTGSLEPAALPSELSQKLSQIESASFKGIQITFPNLLTLLRPMVGLKKLNLSWSRVEGEASAADELILEELKSGLTKLEKVKLQNADISSSIYSMMSDEVTIID